MQSPPAAHCGQSLLMSVRTRMRVRVRARVRVKVEW